MPDAVPVRLLTGPEIHAIQKRYMPGSPIYDVQLQLALLRVLGLKLPKEKKQ